MIPKFRIFDKDTKEWQSIRSIGLEEDGSILYIQCWDKYEVDIDPPYFMDNLGIDFELMQSTGLHDKNGKEIFEGDVVKYIMGMKFTIVFHKNAFGWFEGDDFIPFADMAQCQLPILEVVGNVHEHSHLLDDGGE